MADDWLQGASFGAGLVKEGFDEYWKKKQYQNMIAEQTEAHKEREENRSDMANYRQAEIAYRNKQEADNATYRTKELDRQKARDAAEVRHWRALEGIAKERADKVGTGRGSSAKDRSMTPSQATAAIREIDQMFSKKDAPAMDASTWNRREKFKQIQDPSYQPRPYQAPPPSWLQRHLPAWAGGTDSASSEGGSSLPGLE